VYRFIAAIAVAAAIPAAFAQTQPDSSIPNLASKDFGWQTNFEDWQDPRRGNGHGPMKNDPAFPFVNNSVVDRARKRSRQESGHGLRQSQWPPTDSANRQRQGPDSETLGRGDGASDQTTKFSAASGRCPLSRNRVAGPAGVPGATDLSLRAALFHPET